MRKAASTHVHAGGGAGFLDVLLLALAALAVTSYVAAVLTARRRGREWPFWRVLAWIGGVALGALSVTGPVATAARNDFVVHMWGHLAVGMAAPVLLVLAAPVTLALRSLPVTPARRLSRMLRSWPVRIVSSPVVAAVLSAGGLWVLYLTPLLPAMHHDPVLHVLVHAHLLGAGYLFTAAVIGRDPRPHRSPRAVLVAALIVAMASHAVLAKYLYASPPEGVAIDQAREGAQLMYYAGAWVEAAIIVVFCADWYRAAGRRRPSSIQAVSTSSAKYRAAEPENTGRAGSTAPSTTSQTTAVTLSSEPASSANATKSLAAWRGVWASRSTAATSGSGT